MHSFAAVTVGSDCALVARDVRRFASDFVTALGATVTGPVGMRRRHGRGRWA